MTTALLRKEQPVMWFELAAELRAISEYSSVEITAALYHLLWHGYLTTNLNRLILVDAAPAATALTSLAEQECPQ